MKSHKHSAIALAILVVAGLACNYLPGRGGGEFTSASDKFSVAFPGGPGDVKTESGKAPKFAVNNLPIIASKLSKTPHPFDFKRLD